MFAREIPSRALGYALPVSDGWRPSAPPCMKACSAQTLLEIPLNFSPQVPVGDLAAAVATLLAFGESELDLRPLPLEIEARRNQRQAPLGGLADQPLDLPPVQEQLPRPVRIVVLVGGRQVRRDVSAALFFYCSVDH